MERQRTTCPGCGRDVAFVTDLAVKHRHTGDDGRWCPVRTVVVGA